MTGMSEILRKPDEADSTMEEVFELTLPSKVRYAKKHGYDLLTLRSFGSGSLFGFKDTNLGLLRMVRSLQMLNFYDVVVWIDADTILTNDSMTVQDFGLNEDYVLYTSYDWPTWAVPHHSISTGNFILKKNKNLEKFVRAFLEVGKRYTEGWGEEQSTINWLYQHTDIRNIIKILDHKYLGGVPASLMKYRLALHNDRTPIYSPWDRTHFLSHITGLPNKIRVEILRSEYKDFL